MAQAGPTFTETVAQTGPAYTFAGAQTAELWPQVLGQTAELGLAPPSGPAVPRPALLQGDQPSGGAHRPPHTPAAAHCSDAGCSSVAHAQWPRCISQLQFCAGLQHRRPRPLGCSRQRCTPSVHCSAAHSTTHTTHCTLYNTHCTLHTTH